MLNLQITSFTDNANWEWRLEDEHGVFLADQVVELDRSSSEYSGFIDLYRFVRWNEAGTDERDLVARVAKWIRTEVWGAVGDTILDRAEQAPITVHLLIPPEAHGLLFLPLEVGLRLDASAGAMEVSLVCVADKDTKPPTKRPIGDRLRMLGVFSMPTDQAALNVRRERHELAKLVHRVARAAGRAVELRILQYGVTRESIEDVLYEGEGWDLIHFSGHGLPAGLVLEHEDGSADIIKSDEFSELLWPNRAQLKLVTLSSCESGAAEAAYTLQLLGIETPGSRPVRAAKAENSPPLPAVAQAISTRLGCAALAMRYPVEDDFAIVLSGDLYEGLLANDLPLPLALQRALGKAQKRQGEAFSALSLATPALFGAAARDLRLSPPPGEPTPFDPANATMAEFPTEPETFVGRVGPLARASAALAPKSPMTSVLFHGMAGAGKTACALELSYRHRNLRFEATAWYSAPPEGSDISEALNRFAASLQTQVDGLELAHVVDDKDSLEAFLPRFRQLLADRSLLLVLDNIESLLTPDGRWRDPRWGLIFSTLVGHNGLSRLVLTSRIPPKEMLADPRIRIEPIHSLSANEAVLLARQMPNLGSLMLNGVKGDLAAGRSLVRRTLQVVQGNPKLIQLADAQGADPEGLLERIEDADAAWADRGNLDAFFATGEPAKEIAAEDFLQVIQRWTNSIANEMTGMERLAFHIVCCLEERDRTEPFVEAVWSMLAKQSEGQELDNPHPLLETVGKQGLLDIKVISNTRHFGIHPAVESAALESISGDLGDAVDKAAITVWMGVYKEASAERQTPILVHSCLGAAPYLLRREEPDKVAVFLGMAITQDTSMPVLAAVIPLLGRAAEQAAGKPGELAVRTALTRAQAAQRSRDVIPDLKELIELAQKENDFQRVSSLRSELFDALMRAGHLNRAEKVLDELDAAESGRVPPWSQLANKGMRLQLLRAKGNNKEVLEEVSILRKQIETMKESDGRSDIISWPIREAILDTGGSAALALGEWEKVLELTEAIQASERERNSPSLTRAITAMNAFGPLLELGRLDEAEEILVRLRATLEDSEDLRRMGEVFGSWAILEVRRGHIENAIAFEYKALKHNYLQGELNSIVTNHQNLASDIVNAEGDPKEILAHRSAAALMMYQVQSGDYPQQLVHLARSIHHFGTDALPQSFEELCAHMDQIEGCKFSSLFPRLPATAPTGRDAFEAMLADAKIALDHISNREQDS